MKNLLCFVDDGPNGLRRLEVATRFAAGLDAHLAAVAVTLEPIYAFAGGSVAAAEILARQVEAARSQAENLAAGAEEKLKASGLGYELRTLCLHDAAVAQVAARHARHADLSILGYGEDADSLLVRELFDGVLFESGRPVLVMPSKTDPDTFAKRVTIAWDAGKLAARAVGDALPLLKRADEVAIAVVDPAPGMDAFGEEPGGDIAAALARHGLKVELRQLTRRGRSIAETLQTDAREWGAGMLVMGGYSHSQFRESIFGGVTHTLLHQDELALFMSH